MDGDSITDHWKEQNRNPWANKDKGDPEGMNKEDASQL